jgi:plasmid maintenance system antidote protein VapI
MSTQQQIDAWRTAVAQKEQERADQATILKVQREEFAKAEEARNNAELALQRARSAGASPEQVAALQRQVQLADQAESQANIAAGQTADNIAKLDGSIRYNQSQLALYQGALPAQGTPASTVADQPVNAATNAAEIAPAPQPQSNAPAPVPGSAIEEGGDAEGLANRPISDPTGVLAAEDQAIAEQQAAQSDADAFAGLSTVRDPTGVLAAEDQAIADAQAEQDEIDAFAGLARGPTPVPGNFTAISDPEGTAPNNWGVWNDDTGVFESTGLNQQEAQIRAENLSLGSDEPIPQGTPGGTGLTPEEQLAKDQAAAKAAAINQATRNSVYNKAGSSDWRVRLQLAPGSNYLYNANPPGILGPLAPTNGVIFPYTPQINTSYKANYEQYDLVHSNYRGVYYKNSRVDDLSIRGVFTAQDTREADYLLAVIHFFRSVTKMFYGKDEQRGSPPPLVYLSGLGMNQFFGHPCVVSSFQYNLPDQVDYIRATSVNNYGTDLLSRRTPGKAAGAAGLGASGNRILNAGLERFFPAAKPAPDPVVASVNNTQLANYVPTKMEIDITLIPVQTRSQVSKQFSLKGFANGDLIKGGFW